MDKEYQSNGNKLFSKQHNSISAKLRKEDEQGEEVSKDKKVYTEKTAPRTSLYERNRRTVYEAGNKWAIENFHATHD